MTTTCLRSAPWVIGWDAKAGRHAYLNNADVVFRDDKIIHVGGRYEDPVDVEIDASRHMVMPGLINIHSHPATEPVHKGVNEEVGSRRLFMSSLYEYMPVFRGDHSVNRAAVKVALCEMLKSGCTTVVDLSMPYPGWMEALADSGIRAVMAPMYRSGMWRTRDGHSVQYDWDEAAGKKAMLQALDIIDSARKHPSGRLSGMICPAQIDTCSEDLFRESMAAAKDKGLKLHTHAAQSIHEFYEMARRTGETPIRWLEKIGVLSEDTIIAHAIFLDHHPLTVWYDKRDLDLLRDTGSSVAHCPTVFARRGMVMQDLSRYRREGVKVGIGTDTIPHNMLEEMRLAGLLTKLMSNDVAAIYSGGLLDVATVDAAKIIGMDNVGRLEAGAKADVVMVDLDHWAMRPIRDPLRSMMYTAAERGITDVFIDGERRVKGGVVQTIDFDEALDELAAAQARVLETVQDRDWAGRSATEVSPLTLPYMS